MLRVTSWLLLFLVIALAGCRQSDSKSSSSGGGTQTTATTSGSGGAGSGSSAETTGTGMSATAKSDSPAGQTITTASGLKYQDLVIGTGEEATVGRTVSVHYTGWLTDGSLVDSSVERGQPIEFPLGTPGIIQGWTEGLTGMKVGGKRHLTIPPNLGYGEAGRAPKVPPNATLIFDVQLVGVK